MIFDTTGFVTKVREGLASVHGMDQDTIDFVIECSFEHIVFMMHTGMTPEQVVENL